MARPKKETIDYFPHIIKEGKTIFILESKFGNDGYAFWFKLLEQLGKHKGLVYDCNNPSDWMFLLAKTLVTEDIANSILNTLADLGAIDLELWENRIVWSQNFVDGISDVFKRRECEVPQKPSLCKQKPPQKEVSVNNNPRQEVISDNNNPQIKLNKTKLNKTKLSFEEWGKYCHESMNKLFANDKWINQMETDFPTVNIKRTVEKAFELFFATKTGWKNKKGNPNSDWEKTMDYQLGCKGSHRVFKPYRKPGTLTDEEFINGCMEQINQGDKNE